MKIIKTKKIVDDSVKPGTFNIIITSFFYTGFFPFASGTAGSIAGLLPFLIPGFGKIPVLIAAIVLFSAAALFNSSDVIRKYGDDPSVIVIDEVIGMWVTVLVFMLLDGGNVNTIQFVLLFFAFRFFDIVKIQPARYFDNMKNPTGILMDDVVSGIYAGAAVFLFSLTKFTDKIF